MPQDTAISVGLGPDKADITQHIEPSIRNALPHYLPLGIFPLLLAAAAYGGWWLLPAFLFMSVAGPLDRALGPDGRNMDPAKTSERHLLWHNLPVWAWAFLWPPTLIFGMWQILVANRFAIWEDVLLVIILTMEAQAVFVVGHEFDSSALYLGKAARRISPCLCLLSAIRHGACLYTPCLGRHAA